MPYQGPNGYVPPGNYGNYAAGAFQPGQAHLYQRNGRPGYPQQQIAGHPQQLPHAQQQQTLASYRPPSNRPQAQYSTPQYYERGQQSSYYQSPSPSVQYQQLAQQPYLSPPSQTGRMPQSVQYSPDPLSFYQAPPQPRQTPPQGHQQRQQQQRPPSLQSQQQATRPSLQPPQHRPQHQSTPQSASSRADAAATMRNSRLSQPHQQQRIPSQPSPQSGSRRAPTQSHTQAPQTQQRASSQVRTSSESTRPDAPQHQRHSSQVLAHQAQQPSAPRPPATIDPNVIQRRAAHVEIPLQRAPIKSEEDPMARSPKRRRSNDGQAVSVREPLPAPQRSTASQRPKQPPLSSSPLTELASSQMPPAPTPANIDYQAVLLGLSDEYISAAFSMTSDLAGVDVSEEQLDQYHQLLSTGMGCLDTVLKNYRIPEPRREARIRLRLASLLYEETKNNAEAAEILSKGITLCERARLPDLKYAMHHLLARIGFKGSNTKAAMKVIDKHVAEAEKLNLVHWVYAFRFLRISLGLQLPISQAETAMQVKHLTAITDVAASNHHITVLLVAATLEAMIHLRSRSPDSVDLAQRALAAARTHQLSSEMASMPQIRALLDAVDLGCTLALFDPHQADAKVKTMQGNMDVSTRDPGWNEDGSWHIPLGPITISSPDIEADTGGILHTTQNGEAALTFNWLTNTQIYTLGFMLSGLAGMHKNSTQQQRAESFFREGVKYGKFPLDAVPQSLNSASAQYQANSLMRIMMRVYSVFALCGRSEWDLALRGIVNLRNKDFNELDTEPEENVVMLLAYLEAVCKHGLGDVNAALKLYRSPELRLKEDANTKPTPSSEHPIRVLAGLNSILIMRLDGKYDDADRLLQRLEGNCVTVTNNHGSEHGSKAVESAFMILKSTEEAHKGSDNLIIKTKHFLQQAVKGAQSTLNNQLLCIVMNLMTNLFFNNIVGDQAEKSARSGRTLAKRAQDTLWTAVADRM